ncbi:myo-inositol 2-dehydrogenase/D-chiro-inositol 1-dehydrogenase [Prauserella shujinwangii]|uniref:Myo-inositol 2-dehydrogenase/D-chiro-inositol 1-dehydrogenase n=1 Tax=Prauserella shujinwangii TaxID=1453103 RepID=A0A2T0LKP4_9PSEU|nr:Gfo/Idh/MocA family oxidoreductase [Prauserella shujinwangii]PRX43468.1 myo-inositol 2-dehydrogenase/D-chiro-inositol 1-dehydrogenase [Prauserella shujinwangii]
MRLGLAGTGRIGTAHAETLQGIPGVDSVVVADVDVTRARTAAAKLGTDVVDSVDELFALRPDGLVVCAATDAHPELIIRAVTEGIPVFCEKPVAADVAGTLRVIERTRSSDVPVQIGFQRRFDAGHVAAREAVSAGRLGRLHTVRSTTLDPAPPTAEYVRHSGGLFRDCSVHDFDAIRWVTGREVAEVYALGTNNGATFFAEAGDVDTGAAVLTLDDGTLALVSATRYNGAGYDVRMELFGSAGSLAAGLDRRTPLTSAEPGVPAQAGPPYPHFLDRFREAYVRELTTFTEVVAGRLPSPCTPADALEAFSVAEACERSRAERRPVRLAEVRRISRHT